MSQALANRRRSWRRRTKLTLLISVIVVAALVYWEQSAALYVLSTLAICVVLSLVAVADLEGKDRELARANSQDAPESRGGKR